MNEYFVIAKSFAAPFFSDTDESYIQGESPESALEAFAADYRHPAGLYSATVYANADACLKREEPLAQWLCNHAIEMKRLRPEGSYSYLGHGPGDFEINGVRHKVENPRQGRVA